jgi:hypothetical protein
VFHHESPFDAAAPSRNRERQKAPAHAWSASPEEELAYISQTRRAGDSPYAAAAMPSGNGRSPISPYYNDDYQESPKKNVNAIAEAWGIHEPEPYEDFSAGGGNVESGGASRPATYSRRDKGRSPEEPKPKPTRRPTLPPPQPIFDGDDPIATEEIYPAPSSPTAGGATNLGRNRSIMQRIRKMRDAPNVPVGSDDMPANGNISPTSPSGETFGASRPTHRVQTSFLGRFGKATGRVDEVSPESYVYVEDPKLKDLPSPPAEDNSPRSADSHNGYFDAQFGGGGAGVGRAGSLMRKMRGVVNRK